MVSVELFVVLIVGEGNWVVLIFFRPSNEAVMFAGFGLRISGLLVVVAVLPVFVPLVIV